METRKRGSTSSRRIIPKNSRLKHKTIGFSFFYFIWLFLFLSFLGWLWEVCLYLIIEQGFVNRGILLGPWLPIYGAGGLFLFFLLYRFKRHPIWIFVTATIICSGLEYFCSWFLEKLWNIRWWDYSDYWGNLNGRICLPAGILFLLFIADAAYAATIPNAGWGITYETRY